MRIELGVHEMGVAFPSRQQRFEHCKWSMSVLDVWCWRDTLMGRIMILYTCYERLRGVGH